MSVRINPSRLKIARIRRKKTLRALSEDTGITTRMLSSYESDNCKYTPKEETLELISKSLRYPIKFLISTKDIDLISSESVSFRSLKSMRAKDEQAAISAGSLGVVLNQYFISKVSFIPSPNLPDLRGMKPQSAAEYIREFWDLGNLSITNMIHLLEKNGIRVFSLAENTACVDAFSFWNDEIPYIFLNTQKSGERSRFDAAHELGHLLLHKHGTPQGRDAESEADSFAANFLMPPETLYQFKNKIYSIDDIILLKKNWKVSAMSLIVQSKNTNVLSEWHYRNLIIEASKLGLRTKEINGIQHERSGLIPVIISELETKFSESLRSVSDNLGFPLEETTNLLFLFTSVENNDQPIKITKKPQPKLRLI